MFSRTYLLAVLAAILLATALAPVPQAPSITAEELVKKALDARGGSARIKAVQSEKITGTISFGPGLGGPFFVELKRPLKMHMEMNVQNQTIVRVYDGHGSGWMVNPFAEDKGAVAMSGGELKNITDESDFDGPLVDYQAKGNRVEYLGKDDIDGKPAEKLKLTVKSGEVRTYFLDATTFLLLKWEGVRETPDGAMPISSFFRDYRDVNGLKFAFQVDSGSPKGAQIQQLTIEKIELNPAIDDARFTKPAVPAATAPAN